MDNLISRPAPNGAGLFILMKRNTFIFILLAIFVLGCAKKGGLEQLARENLPAKLAEMTEMTLGSSEGMEIKDIQVIYDCDSLCIVQCRSFAKDTDGNDVSKEVRYFFAQDRFMSFATGAPFYCHGVQDADYLSKEGIREFKMKMDKGGTERFMLSLALCDPVR